MNRLIIVLILLLTGCNSVKSTMADSSPMVSTKGKDPGLEQRHRAVVPEAYASLDSPLSNPDMLKKGEEIYAALCTSCHGDGGLGDGPASQTLTPSPAPISQTSQTMSDGYLYWRIAEGGMDFGSSMPAWKSVLSESDVWSVIAYVRTLGRSEVQPNSLVGGQKP